MKSNKLKIGIAGPITVSSLLHWLEPEKGQFISAGSGGTPVVNLVDSLLKAGHNVSVYSFGFDLSKGQCVRYRGKNLNVYLASYRDKGRMRDFFKQERNSLLTAIKEDVPDIIHSHWTYEFSMAAIESGLPSLVTIHDCARKILKYNTDMYRAGRYLMNTYVMKKAINFSAVSPYVQEYGQKFTNREIQLIPNIVGDEWFTTGDNSHFPRKGKGNFIVASFLQWGNMRNAQTSIRAFTAFRKLVPNSEYHLYGSGFEPHGPAETWSKSYSYHYGLRFHGKIPNQDVRQSMQEADVILHPSLEESFSMVVAESMALGVPIIAGQSTGGIPWVLDFGLAGFLVDVTDDQEICSALLAVYNDPTKTSEFVSYARQRAQSKFSREAVVPLYERIYDRVLEEHQLKVSSNS